MILKQLRGYFISGIAATSTDLGIYFILSKLVLGYAAAKTVSFSCATLVAYIGYRKLTFKSKNKVRPELIKLMLQSIALV